MATGTSPATKRAGTRKTANKLVRFAGGSETSDFLAALGMSTSAAGSPRDWRPSRPPRAAVHRGANRGDLPTPVQRPQQVHATA